MHSSDYAYSSTPGLSESRSGRHGQAGQADRAQATGLGCSELERAQSSSNIHIVSGRDTGHRDKRERFAANTTHSPAHNVSIDRPGCIQFSRDEITVRNLRCGADITTTKQTSDNAGRCGFSYTIGAADSGDGLRHIGTGRTGPLETLRHRPGNNTDIPQGLHPVQRCNKQRATRHDNNLTASYGGNS